LLPKAATIFSPIPVLKEGQTKKVQKKLENEPIGKPDQAIAKESGDENAKAQKDAGKQLLKGLFYNNQADS
jgi:hypothetical protein|tara:strand:+ start:1955 stop:2167 length:213 start_codon:yes stop_codon:yes gene_type:complete